MNEGAKLFYSFGGADILVLVDGKAYGEIEKIDFNSTRKGEELELTCAIFPGIEEFNPKKIHGATILEIFANEHGDKYFKKFNNVKYVGEKESHSIDDLVLSTTYIFTCNDFTRIKELQYSIEDIMKGKAHV